MPLAGPPQRTTSRARAFLRAAVGLTAILLSGCGGTEPPTRSASDVQVLRGTTPQDASAGSVGTYVPTGKLIADTGFRPPADGFTFENYGISDVVRDLTPAAVEGLFGPEVCASGSGATCALIPPARAWMEVENDAMRAGHCFGRALSASRFYGGTLRPEGFGAPSPAQLTLTGNPALQRTIAQGSALQELPAIRRKAIPGTPNDILDTLIAGMKAGKPLFVLGLFRADGGGGHAVTPYAVEDRGDGRFAVLVYDNNFPGITRAVSFDRHADAWKFLAQSNPADPRQVYEGHGAQSNLALYPGVTPKGVVPCPFCNGGKRGTRDERSQQFNEIALEGDATNHAHVRITDARGRRTGYVDGRVVNEIPGAQVLRRLNNRTWEENAEPVYLVPANRSVDVLVDADEIRKPVVERLEFIGPGDRVAVEGIELRRGEQVELHVAADGTRVKLETDPAHDESPVVRIGIEHAPDSYDFALKAKRLPGGAALDVRLDTPRRQFDIDTRGVPGHARRTAGQPLDRYDLTVERMTPKGTMTFSHPDVLIPPGTIARLNYGVFDDRHRTLDLQVERGGRTTVVPLGG